MAAGFGNEPPSSSAPQPAPPPGDSSGHCLDEELLRLNRVYLALSQVYRALTKAQDRAALLRSVCEALVEFGEFPLSWIGWDDPDTHQVAIAAQYGGPTCYLAGLAVRSDDTPEGRGPAGTALRSGSAQVLYHWNGDPERRDPTRTPELAPFRASGSFPLRQQGKVVAVLNIYASEEGAFGPEEVFLLEEVAEGVSFALDFQYQEERRRAAEADLMRREAELRQAVASLKQHQEERLALEGQLHHLQRMEGIGRLAGGVAHDMNNVLSAIMSMAAVLQFQGDETGKVAGIILDATQRGRDLVRGLMEFARKEVRAVDSLDLNELVTKEAELFAQTTLGRIALRLELAPDLPRMRGAPGALSTALMNLCVNAVDAMPDGGTLTLRTRAWDTRTLALEVQDTGQGMAPEVLSRALDPYFTTKPVGKGTGLGLSMVYGTVQAHGGRMELLSRPGQGTCARLLLPIQAVGAKSPEPVAAARSRPAGRPLELLVVDDDDLVLQSIPPMLETIGHQVTAVKGGQAALGRLEAGGSWDAVILDLNMPGMDGLETLERLRSLRRDLPVLIATGYADERLRGRILQNHKVGFITKPYSAQEVQEALNQLL